MRKPLDHQVDRVESKYISSGLIKQYVIVLDIDAYLEKKFSVNPVEMQS